MLGTNKSFQREIKKEGNIEDFYVIEASDASTTTVTLLAKYNLNQAGTAQAPNASYDDTKCVKSRLIRYGKRRIGYLHNSSSSEENDTLKNYTSNINEDSNSNNSNGSSSKS